MNISATGYLYCYTACLIYILSSVICGVIRWFHMCHPYDRNADYFYPGRNKHSSFILLYCFNFPICFGLIHRIHGLMSVFLECYITLYVFLCCFYVTSVENSIIKNYVEP